MNAVATPGGCPCNGNSVCWLHAIPTEREGRQLAPEWRTITAKERGGRCGLSCHGGNGLHLYRRKDKTASACWDCALEKGVFGRPPIEICSCPESLALREELASAAAHIAALLAADGGDAAVRGAARKWLDGLEARLP